MAVTVATVIEKVRRQLLAGHRTELNFLSGAMVTADTTITVSDATGGITRAGVVGIEDELLYVRSLSGQVATVVRGHLGTTAASHASGTTVEVNPRFVRGDILDRMKEEVLSWPRELFQVPASASLSVSSTATRGYDLNIGDFYDILDVRRSPADTTSAVWPRVRSYEVVRNLPTANFASGTALFLKEYPRIGSATVASTILVTYAKAFTTSTFAESTDLTGTCGLEESMLDLLQYGTAWRMMAAREVSRTDQSSQVEPRIKDEVPPMHAANTATALKRLRDVRMGEEIDKLRRRWGFRQF